MFTTEFPTQTDLEVARMTSGGLTGIGVQWSNTFQPKRTLDVVRHESVPQFRITRLRGTGVTNGIYTDFETSGGGHLHIFPRLSGDTMNVGIGFLSNLGDSPTERLDVYEGTARLRNVPDSLPDVLITGRMQEIDPTTGDYILNHLKFSNNPNQFLNGQGEWANGTNVCDWNISGQNLVMGYTGACHTGDVGVGRSTPTARLDVLEGTPGVADSIGVDGSTTVIRGVIRTVIQVILPWLVLLPKELNQVLLLSIEGELLQPVMLPIMVLILEFIL